MTQTKPLLLEWYFVGLDIYGRETHFTYSEPESAITPNRAMEIAEELREGWKCPKVRVELRLDPFRPKEGWEMTTPEEMRAREIEACDRVLDAPWVVAKLIGAEGRRLARANRTYWQQAPQSELERLKAIYDAEPLRANEIPDEDPAKEGGK